MACVLRAPQPFAQLRQRHAVINRILSSLCVPISNRELGVQTVMLAWRLFGGNTSTTMPGDNANMFTYTGPRGMLVRGLFDKTDVARTKDEQWLDGVSVVVGTPEAFAAAIAIDAIPLDCVVRHCRDDIRVMSSWNRSYPWFHLQGV